MRVQWILAIVTVFSLSTAASAQKVKKGMSDAEARAACDQQFKGSSSGKGSNKYAKKECRQRLKKGE